MEDSLSGEFNNPALYKKLYSHYEYESEGHLFTRDFLDVFYRQNQTIQMSHEYGSKIAKLFIESEKTQYHYNGVDARKDQTNSVLQMVSQEEVKPAIVPEEP